jgi:CDP-diacylglycerol--glycerol-3-phosphate 3-phosphatidyltransferase/cardiolipin synthase
MATLELHGAHRALRDAVRPPGLVSLARVGLAAACPFVVTQPALAVGVLAAAALSDVLDGWLARRLDQVTPTGAVLDAVADKVFVAAIVVSLLVVRRMAWFDPLLLSTREILEAPLLVRAIVRHDTHERRANIWGKATTSIQFVAILLALMGGPYRPVAIACALGGIVASIAYARDEARQRA